MASYPKKNAPRESAVEPDLDDQVPSVEEAVAAVVEPAAEMQESVRTALDKSVTESRAAFARVKASADDAASAFEVSVAAAKDGVLAINAKALQALRANTEASLDFVKASFSVKTVSELVALQTEFARKQADAMSAQAKDLGALARKTMLETIEPVKEQVARAFKIVV